MRRDSPPERLELTIAELLKRKFSGAVISDPRHVYYLTGFFSYKPRPAVFLLIDCDKSRSTLVVGRTEEGPATASPFTGSTAVYQDYDINRKMILTPDDLAPILRKAMIGSKIRGPIAFEEWHLPAAYLETVKKAGTPKGISRLILAMRKRKGKDEVASHTKAASRLDDAYGVAKALASSGKTELDLFRAANSDVFRASGPAEHWMNSNVQGDFVSGSRALDIGGPPSTRVLSSGETIILDLQTCYEGYWADTARTFVVGRRPSKRQSQIFETLLAARTAAEELLRPGTRAGDVYRAVSETLEKAGFARLPHHAGHGVGLDGQEPPYFLPNSDEELEEGVVCAVEPGIYDTKAGGIRIEDDYVITRSGFEKTSAYGISMV